MKSTVESFSTKSRRCKLAPRSFTIVVGLSVCTGLSTICSAACLGSLRNNFRIDNVVYSENKMFYNPDIVQPPI